MEKKHANRCFEMSVCAVALAFFAPLIEAQAQQVQHTTAKESQVTSSTQKACEFSREITRTVGYKYLLHLPRDYDKGDPKPWPLILYLHGSGERGEEPERLRTTGVAEIAERDPAFPFIVVSPLCPLKGYGWWRNDALMALLEEVEARYAVDRTRIYVTGFSMGGYGTWNLASEFPEHFAAIAPLCGAGYDDVALQLKNVPAWVFHGAKDSVVPPKESIDMVNAMKAIGAEVRFTLYPDLGHGIWNRTYSNPELYSWFLQHRKSAVPSANK